VRQGAGRRGGTITLAAALLLLGGCAAAAPAPTPTVAPAVTPDGRQRIELSFAGGAVVGGVQRYAVPRGSTVELVVSSDVAERVHVRGYDRFSYVTAGASTTLRFVADRPGVVEVELDERGVPLAQLQA
jgi:hypothetical protein